MFGTHFSVELHSAWRTNKLEDMKQDSLAEEFISTESPEDVSEDTESPEDVSEDTENPEEETNETEETDNMDGDSEIISQDDKDDEENKEK